MITSGGTGTRQTPTAGPGDGRLDVDALAHRPQPTPTLTAGLGGRNRALRRAARLPGHAAGAAGPQGPGHQKARERLGGRRFDAAAFDLAAVNTELAAFVGRVDLAGGAERQRSE